MDKINQFKFQAAIFGAKITSKLLKTFSKSRKKLVIGIAAGVTAAAVGCGFWYKAGHRG